MVAYEKPITALVWVEVDGDRDEHRRLLTLCGVNRVLVAHTAEAVQERLEDSYIDVVVLAGRDLQEASRIAYATRRADSPSPYVGVALLTDRPDADDVAVLISKNVVSAVCTYPVTASDLEPVLDHALHAPIGAAKAVMAMKPAR